MLFFKKILPEGSLSAKSWNKLRRNKTAAASMIVILIASLVSILGYLVSPDSTPFANNQILEIAASKPGFKVQLLLIKKNEPAGKCNLIRRLAYGCKSAYTSVPISNWNFKGDEILVTRYDKAGFSPDSTNTYSYKLADVIYALDENAQQKPGAAELKDINGATFSTDIKVMQQMVINKNLVTRRYLLGTDRFGRDVLSQLMIGTRVSLSVGFISVLISLVLGILLGALAGFFRGRTDDLIVWFINVIWSIPTLLLVIAITFALGKGFWQVFIAVGLTMWVEVARVVRGQILSLREKEF
ncbi:MAG: ABC transporter permease, partial [Lentimicrobium sp.]|nr:ABC transporter permease [Lentimicrobium sp.]